MNLPIKSHPFIIVATFSDVVLVSNYHDCKEEAINLIPHYLIDIIHDTIRSSKYQITQNINKLMFQVIFKFFDWILIKQIIVSSTPFLLGKTDFLKNSTWSFDWGTGAWVKMHRFKVFSRNVKTINWIIFPTYFSHKFFPDITKWCKVCTKTDSWFQKSHEEFEELQTSSGMSKKLKSDGLLLSKKYICPKNTFLQLKRYIYRIYLMLLSTTSLKIHQNSYVISETIFHYSWLLCIL